MPISTINQNGLNAPLTLTAPVFSGNVTATTITSPAATALTLQSAGTTAVTIDTSQNVGIGVTNPSVKLQVNGATTIAGTIIQNAALFQMNGNGNADLRLVNTAGTSGRRAFDWLSNGDNLRARLLSDDGGSLITDNLLVINWDGNVIMGNSSWDYSVNGFGFGAGNSYSYFTRTSGFALGVNRKTTTGDLMAFWYNGSGVGNVSTNGSNCTFNSTSDYRLKENIAPMTGALARVAKLKPVTYNWIRENQAGEGFIAHELQEVVPEAVTGTKDAVDEEGNPVYQAIDQSVLVATLTAAIQELKADFDAYKASHP